MRALLFKPLEGRGGGSATAGAEDASFGRFPPLRERRETRVAPQGLWGLDLVTGPLFIYRLKWRAFLSLWKRVGSVVAHSTYPSSRVGWVEHLLVLGSPPRLLRSLLHRLSATALFPRNPFFSWTWLVFSRAHTPPLPSYHQLTSRVRFRVFLLSALAIIGHVSATAAVVILSAPSHPNSPLLCSVLSLHSRTAAMTLSCPHHCCRYSTRSGRPFCSHCLFSDRRR